MTCTLGYRFVVLELTSRDDVRVDSPLARVAKRTKTLRLHPHARVHGVRVSLNVLLNERAV
jgi:hypothetical protein